MPRIGTGNETSVAIPRSGWQQQFLLPYHRDCEHLMQLDAPLQTNAPGSILPPFPIHP